MSPYIRTIKLTIKQKNMKNLITLIATQAVENAKSEANFYNLEVSASILKTEIISACLMNGLEFENCNAEFLFSTVVLNKISNIENDFYLSVFPYIEYWS